MIEKVFKRTNEIPPPPKLPTPSQIIDDLKMASVDDPVFFGNFIIFTLKKLNTFVYILNFKGQLFTNFAESSMTHNSKSDDSFRIAKDFITSSVKLKEVERVLVLQKSQLEESFRELQIMSENIRQQATEALTSIY